MGFFSASLSLFFLICKKKYISEFTLTVMYLIGCGFVCWPNYKGSAYTLVGWEELGFMNLFPLLYCLNSFGLVLIPSSCL